MAPTPPSGEQAGLRDLRDAYRRALLELDARRSRTVVMEAARGGMSRATLYEQVVRPSLHALVRSCRREGRTAEERLAVASVQAALVELTTEPRLTTAVAPRRRPAIVSVGTQPLEALDGQVIVDLLEADGWTVEEITPAMAPEEVVERCDRDQVELIVLPTSSAADLLLAAPTYTLLRRMADPPYIVACGLGAGDGRERARLAGADEYAHELDSLLALVRQALPHRVVRRWGLRIRRSTAGTLILAPTGSLDFVSADRMRQVVESRDGLFARLLIDLRDVADCTPDGVDELLLWAAGPQHALVSGPRVSDALALGQAADTMAVFDDHVPALQFLETA
jgi:methanogenic corrinoid protein MtbC1